MLPAGESSKPLPSAIPWDQPLGLALSGGGARGAYQLGCWLAFKQYGLEFEAIAGNSIGALNGALMCQGDYETARALWNELTRIPSMKPDPRKLRKLASAIAIELGILLTPIPSIRLLRTLKYAVWASRAFSRYGSTRRLVREGLWSPDQLRDIIEPYVNMRKVIRSPLALYVSAFGSLRMGVPPQPLNWFHMQNLTEDEAWNALMASMALPLFLPPVKVHGRMHRDLGTARRLPLAPLRTHGCRSIVAVSTKASTNLGGEVSAESSVILIQPSQPLARVPLSALRFKKETIDKWIDQGYRDATRVLKNGETAVEEA